MVTFIFGSNLSFQTIAVKGITMKNAMHWAAIKLGVKECNLTFIKVLK